jgi:hypothetical protein
MRQDRYDPTFSTVKGANSTSRSKNMTLKQQKGEDYLRPFARFSFGRAA